MRRVQPGLAIILAKVKEYFRVQRQKPGGARQSHDVLEPMGYISERRVLSAGSHCRASGLNYGKVGLVLHRIRTSLTCANAS